jgi:hypothetical protein
VPEARLSPQDAALVIGALSLLSWVVIAFIVTALRMAL